MLFLWYLSLFISIFSLFIGLSKKSWILLLISTISSLPFSFYILGAENGMKLIGMTPLLLLILTLIFGFGKK